MHPLASDPDVQAVVRSPSVEVDVVCELQTSDGWVDISDDLHRSGQVDYQLDRTLHRTGQVTLSRNLTWGVDRIRLSMTLSASEGTFTVPVGVLLVSTPSSVADEEPATWQVDCYDLLWLLDDVMGETFVAAEGNGHLETVRGLVSPSGLDLTLANEAAGDVPIAEDLLFPLDEELTRLQVVNRLLERVGYRGLWVDWQGRARSEPIVGLANRPVEWLYDAGADDTEVAEGAVRERDTWGRINRLVAVPEDPDADLDRVELTVADGRPQRSKVVSFDAADQETLGLLAAEELEKARRVDELFEVGVSANPLHAHRDVVRFVSPSLAVNRKCVVDGWRLPLDGSDMSLTLRAV